MTKPIEPGCLAIVIGTRGCDCLECEGNRDKIVTVVRALAPGETLPCIFGPMTITQHCWLVRSAGSALVLVDGPFAIRTDERPFLTQQLRRIDNPDGRDETLDWAPVPTGVAA